MKNLLAFLFISAVTLNAKEVYFADAVGIITSETVDPVIKLWFLKDYFFRKERIDLKRYALGIKTSKGFDKANVDDELGQFGESENGPVVFHIVPVDEKTGKLKELTQVPLASDCRPIVKEAVCPQPAQGAAPHEEPAKAPEPAPAHPAKESGTPKAEPATKPDEAHPPAQK